MPTYPPNTYRNQDEIGPPPAIPSTSYGIPEEQYGVPSQATSYGPPSSTPAPVIHKHIYVHVPPSEPDYPAATRPPPEVQPAQKHYRIIFIKAPTQAIPTLPPLLPAPENEEKTIVYVLVRRPDDAPEVVVPTPAPTIPSKPEVYFIRYRTEVSTTSAPEIISEPGGYYR